MNSEQPKLTGESAYRWVEGADKSYYVRKGDGKIVGKIVSFGFDSIWEASVSRGDLGEFVDRASARSAVEKAV